VNNQAGVALEGPDFELLTEERAHEVNQHIIAALKDLDCRVDGYCFCPYVTHEYAHNAALKGRSVSPNYIDDKARCLKPSIGMFEDAAKLFGKTFSELQHTYMIGDRAVDIEMGLRGGCVSILVESSKTRELGDLKKVLAMQEKFPDAVFIAADFLAAAVQIRDMCYTSLI
jgi:histidinol phosphatase-like enzyme